MKTVANYKGIEIWASEDYNYIPDKFFANYGAVSSGFPRYIGGNSIEEVSTKIQDVMEIQGGK